MSLFKSSLDAYNYLINSSYVDTTSLVDWPEIVERLYQEAEDEVDATAILEEFVW